MRRFANLILVSLTLTSLFATSLSPILPVSASPLRAVTISPTNAGAIISDDGDGKADPGETIEYTITIPNTGSTNATGLTFTDVIDANTTLVGGSVNVSPLAINDSYETIGNTLLEVGVTAGSNPAVHVSGNLFDNDMEFLGDAGTFSIASHSDPSNGTLVSIDSNAGTFSYLPNVNFSGADTFTYTLQDSGGLTDTTTVTINVASQRVWYVRNDAIAGGLGRSTDPFDTLGEAQAASSINDTIYISAGNGTTSGQNAGITLKNGQRLIGEGAALTVPISVNGGPNPTTLQVAGSAPMIDNTAGNGVSVTDISNVEIRGLNIAGSVNGIDVTTTAANGGSFEIAGNTIRSAGVEGIDVNGGGSGILTVNLHDTAVTSTGNGIDIQRTAGNINVTAFNNNSITGNTGGIGINIVGTGTTILFDATPSTAAFNTVSGGVTTIGQSGNGVGTSGLVLNNVRGDLNFVDLDIYADNGNALLVNGTTPNYTGTTGMRVTANTTTPTLSATGGAAANLTQAAVNLVLTSLVSTNSTATGVSLVQVSGTFSAASGSSINNANGADFFINGNNTATATVSATYGGTITDDLGTLVQIQSVTGGGTHIFSGAITDGDDGDGSGILLTNNNAANITFSGGLILSTSTNAAFTATGGGTINICDENPCNPTTTGAVINKLTTTTGTALNVSNTIIGANKLEFSSISSNGAANGILLNNTGAVGNLIVKGDNGSSNNSSGGTIQNTTGHGISLTTTQSVSFDQMNIQNTGGSGINGVDVTNFSFTNGTINNSGNAIGESNIAFNGNGLLSGNNLDGTLTVTGSTLTNAYEHGIHVVNDNGTISSATIQNNTITSTTSTTTSKGSGIQLIGLGTTTTAGNLTQATISSNTIRNFPSAAGIQVIYSNSNVSGPGAMAGIAGDATNIISITGNTVEGFNTATRFGTNAIYLAVGGANSSQRSQGNFDVSNNPSIKNSSMEAILILNDGYSTITATVNNNIIVANNTFGTVGISGGNGSNIAETPNLTMTVSGNNISQTDGSGILLAGRGSSGMANFGVRNNTVASPLSGVNPGIRVDAGGILSGDDSVCLDISNNITAGSGGSPGIGLYKQGTVPTINDFGIEGLLATSSPGIEFFVGNSGQNPGSANGSFGNNGVDLLSAASGFSNCSTVAMQSPDNQAMTSVESVTQTSTTIDDSTFLISISNPLNMQTPAFSSAGITDRISWDKSQASTFKSSTNTNGGKPLFRISQPAPAQSGETVNVTIGTLPTGKSLTIKFQVTVDNPLPPGTAQISNQGTVTGSNFSNILTDDPSTGGLNDPTITQVDQPVTTVSSINRDSSSATNASSVSWTVTFANAVTNLTGSNFTLVNGGLGGSPVITGVTSIGSVPSTQWTVTANTGTGDGSLGLNLTNDTGLSHDVTNQPFTGEVYTIDLTAPFAVISSTATDPTSISPIPVTIQFSEIVNGFIESDISPGNGTTGNFIAVDGDTYTFDLTPIAQGLVTVDIAASVATDGIGNANTTATQFTHTYNSSSPAVTISSTTSNPTNASPIPVTVQFSKIVTGFIESDITPGNGTISNFIAVDGDTYTFDLTPIAQGPVTADIAPNVASDAIGNNNSAATQFSRTYDSIAPTVTINQSAIQPDPTNISPINFTVIFSDPMTGFATGDVTFSGTAGATTGTVTEISPNDGTTYNVAASGMTISGTVIASIQPTSAQDAAGNGNAASASTDNTVTYTHDNTKPTVVSSLRAGSNPTSAANVDFTITFSESVTGVDINDFSLTTSGVSTAAVSGVSGSGSIYTVTVNTGSGNGTIRLDILNNNTIMDAELNPLSAGFINGEYYTMINKSAIFSDVPYEYWANSYIERLYNAGITDGCSINPLRYCPDEKITRAQMAVLLLKTIHGSSYTPPNATGTIFADIPTNFWAAAWIEQFRRNGITYGCGYDSYCPNQIIGTRAQIAVFLLRGKHGPGYIPPAPSGIFNDVPATYWAAAWIEQIAKEGISDGCGNGNYCPDTSLTRAQIAVLLVKTFNLP